MTAPKNSQTPWPSCEKTMLGLSAGEHDTDGRVSPCSEKPAAGGTSPEAWAAYKREKRRELTARGYRVYSTSTSDHWIQVVVLENRFFGRGQVWANVKFFIEPSEFGIEGGRISKLTIETILRVGVGGLRTGRTLFHFERGLNVDLLKGNRLAGQLFADILRELN